MNEYQIAGLIGCAVFALCMASYVFSWVAQHGWAWVDDSEVGKENWLASKFTSYSEWKYPVYNLSHSEIETVLAEGDTEPFGYSNDKQYKDGSIRGLTEGVEYLYSHRVSHKYWFSDLSLLATILPLMLLCAVKVYPVTLSVMLMALVMYTLRFARRGKKVLDKHMLDKSAHQ